MPAGADTGRAPAPTPRAGEAAPSPAAAEAAAVPPAAAPREDSALGVVRQAYVELAGRLFREIVPRELLGPAWRAVAAEARRQGLGGLDLAGYEARGSDDIDGFARELSALLAQATDAGATPDATRLGQAAVRGMAQAVGDSHTRFLSPEQAENQRRAAEGDLSYSGIGVSLDATGGVFTITEVYSNSPADRAGLRSGDRIVRVNGRDTSVFDLTDLSSQVRGPEGSEVQLTIQRNGNETFDFTLNRARITLPVVVSRMLDGDVGYIKIASLPRRSASIDTARDFDEQLARLLAQGARGIVLDLRGNPGGDPFTSVAIASNFVPDGPIFVTVNREGRRTVYPATTRTTRFAGPVAVLVNRGTASGAEVIASALQEYGAGPLIGGRTCGCLSVGRPLQLGDASGLMVTVEKALTGRQERSLEGVGLEPDLPVAVTPRPGTDAQLDRALAHVRARLP